MNEVNKHYAGLDDTRAGRNAGHAADQASDALETATDWGRDQLRSASRAASSLERKATRQLGRGRREAEAFVAENPIMVGVVGLAAGLLVGSLLPLTRRENRVFGRYADEMRDQGIRYARDLAEQGKHYVEESLDRAKTAAADAANG
jgi:ElaB/YqjD/DUF883 family membrane-anchored ribosome-binding protein